MTATTPPDLNTKMTERARRVWSEGDFARAGAEQVIVGEFLARAIDIHPGQRVPETQEADAQAVPFADGTFDVVLSTFGVMFAPDQSRAAAELRPTGSGGTATHIIPWKTCAHSGASPWPS